MPLMLPHAMTPTFTFSDAVTLSLREKGRTDVSLPAPGL